MAESDKPQSNNPGAQISRRRLIKVAGALAAGIAAPAVLRVRTAYAAYPDRPIKIVVANTPGGPSDMIARLMAAALQEQMGGSTFIVENKGGAGSNIGMGFVARSDPDGYTILLATNAYSVNVGLYNSIPYDPAKDFVPIADLASSPHAFSVQPDSPAKTMQEFVKMAKADPEKFNISVPPVGTTPQLQAEVLKLREGLKGVAIVPFKGGGDAVQALLTKTVQMNSGVLAPAHPHIKAGTIKALAVTGEKRWHDLPDVPTMLDAGYKDFVFATNCCFMAPAKTPPELVARLEKESLAVLARPEMREKLAKSGFDVQAKNGKALGERVNKEITVFKDVIEKAGIKKI